MEEITRKIIEYRANYWFRNFELEEQLAEELAIAIMAEIYKNICTSLYNFITFLIYLYMIFQILDNLYKYVDSRQETEQLLIEFDEDF